MNFFKRLFAKKDKIIPHHNCQDHFGKWEKHLITFQKRHCQICNLEQIRGQFDRV